MVNKLKLLIKENPVLTGAVFAALLQLAYDVSSSDVDWRTAVKGAVLLLIGTIQRSQVTPVSKQLPPPGA